MPRYFFHVHDGTERLDRDGIELANPAEARKQAVVASGEAERLHRNLCDCNAAARPADKHGNTATSVAVLPPF